MQSASTYLHIIMSTMDCKNFACGAQRLEVNVKTLHHHAVSKLQRLLDLHSTVPNCID